MFSYIGRKEIYYSYTYIYLFVCAWGGGCVRVRAHVCEIG